MGKYKRKFIGTLLVLLLPILLPRIMIRFGVVDMLSEAYHNFLLDRVEEIHIEDEDLMGNTESNINNGGMVAETEDAYYYTKFDLHIYQSDKDFNHEAVLVDRPMNQGKDTINILEDWIIYRLGNKINRMNVNNKKMDTIFRGYTLDIHVMGNWVYFRSISKDFSLCKIYRMDINGRNREILYDGSALDMTMNDHQIYYSHEDNGKDYLSRMNLDGRGKEVISDHFASRNVIVDEDYLYYLDLTKDQLCRLHLASQEIEALSNESISTFVKDEEYIFYTLREYQEEYWEDKGLYRMNLDGSHVLPLDGDNYIDDLGITKEWIFYRTLHGPDPSGLKRIKKEGGSWTNMEYTDTY